jgi:glycosyltransferase involved in cell wall biosynthesis
MSFPNKRVLVLSNNVLSTQNNNGKTLLSFFKNLPKENLFQLYFSSEPPDLSLACKYYRISDNDVINSQFFARKKKHRNCERAEENGNTEKKTSDFWRNALKLAKASDFVRIVRELLWKAATIDYKSLEAWVNSVNPDVIFFCAGDSAFAYDIYEKVCKLKPAAKKVVYVTDDYIMPRRKISPFWWIRRNTIYKKMRLCVGRSDVFLTISKEMKLEYKKKFGKDSINIFNMTTNLKSKSFEKTERDDLILTYAGGLHFNRWKTLRGLGIAIKKFNDLNGRCVILKIYSHQNLNNKIVSSLNVDGATKFCGSLSSNEVKFELNDADILVHVESFSVESMESTRFSISTKIAEYLSVEKCILAIGPANIASMSFLRDSAFCINEINDMDADVDSFLKTWRDLSFKNELPSLIQSQHLFEDTLFLGNEDIVLN